MKNRFILFVAAIIFLSGFAAGADAAEGTYDSRGLRDPFVPLVSKDGVFVYRGGFGTEDSISLKGVLWDPEGKTSMAIINGKIVKEGQEIDEVKVLKIEQDRVYLTVGGRETCVKVGPER